MHSRFFPYIRRGFTLIEILIAIGIMGVLAAIIIVAMNPRENLRSAKDSKRMHEAKEIENSMYQYLIDQWELPTSDNVPQGSRTQNRSASAA